MSRAQRAILILAIALGVGYAWLRGAFVAGYRPLATDQLYGLLGALSMHAVVIEMVHFRHLWMVFAMLMAAAMQADWSTARETEEPMVALRHHRMLEESA